MSAHTYTYIEVAHTQWGREGGREGEGENNVRESGVETCSPRPVNHTIHVYSV